MMANDTGRRSSRAGEPPEPALNGGVGLGRHVGVVLSPQTIGAKRGPGRAAAGP